MSDVVCSDLRETLRRDIKYVAVGPIVKQPGTLPFRIVLKKYDHEYVVHEEYWLDSHTAPDGRLQPQSFTSYFATGNYFLLANDERQAFLDAYGCFCKRLMDHLETSLSIQEV